MHAKRINPNNQKVNNIKPPYNFLPHSRELPIYVYEAGYATDPGYTDKLINLIEKYSLTAQNTSFLLTTQVK